LCELLLAIPGANNLKAKRSAVRKVIDRVRNRFMISITETGLQDKWQRALVGFAVVGDDAQKLQGVVQSVVKFIEELFVVAIVDARHQVIPYEPDIDDRSGFRFD
jgi:uncharacterized protein YlxP (DUF503 family)